MYTEWIYNDVGEVTALTGIKLLQDAFMRQAGGKSRDNTFFAYVIKQGKVESGGRVLRKELLAD